MTKIINWKDLFVEEQKKELVLEDYLNIKTGEWKKRNTPLYTYENIDRLIKWKPDEEYNYFTILNKNGDWALYRSKLK